jgi:hypothetical protein
MIALCEGLATRLQALSARLEDSAEELYAFAQVQRATAENRPVTGQEKLQLAAAILAAASAALKVLRANQGNGNGDR